MVNDRIWTLLSRKLSGEASISELEELQELCAQYPQATQQIKSITGWWMTPSGTDNEFMEATYLQHLERMKLQEVDFQHNEKYLDELTSLMPAPQPTSKKGKTIFAGCLLLVLLVASGMLFFKKNSSAELKTQAFNEVRTQNANRNKIMLPDGSGVWLNSDSKLTYPKEFNKNSREVYLSGEAFFDVVKNPDRPFIIHTDKMKVRVLGTRFNVKAYKDDRTSETSLIKGSVEVFLVQDPKKKFLLKPNEKLVLQNNTPSLAGSKKANSTPTTTEMVALQPLTYMKGSGEDVETSWTRNILSFEDEPFAEVAQKMERWYNVEIIFKNKKWEQQFLSGSFELEDLNEAFKALSFSTGFNYETTEGQVIIY